MKVYCVANALHEGQTRTRSLESKWPRKGLLEDEGERSRKETEERRGTDLYYKRSREGDGVGDEKIWKIWI